MDQRTTKAASKCATNSKWGSVCDDRLEDTGNVALPLACQMMGYTGGELIPRGSVSLAPASQKTWLDDLRCFEGSTHWTGSPATRIEQCNHAGWGLENCSREEDAHLRCLGSGTQEIEDPPLTARFEDVPTTHDGETPFSFHLALSEPIRNGYAAVRDQAFEVIGGTVTRARRVDGQSDRWEIRITPEGDTEVAITLAADRACGDAWSASARRTVKRSRHRWQYKSPARGQRPPHPQE